MEYILVLSDYSGKVGANSTDTLGHIFNYGNNGGFVFVASKTCGPSVLAYSESGRLDLDNEAVKANIINVLPAYYSQNVSNNVQLQDGDEWTVLVPPIVKTKLHGGYPFNKYWDEANPDKPKAQLGCVSVAVSTIISHSVYNITDKGIYYNFYDILKTLRKYQIDNTIMPTSVGDDIATDYEIACNNMARFMCGISTDLHASPEGDQTYAKTDSALAVLANRGFEISDWTSGANYEAAAEALLDNNMLYMEGVKFPSRNGWHAFIADGLSIVSNRNNEYSNPYYYHINWGWNGLGNGYYYGTLFGIDAVQSSYHMAGFFSVKRKITTSY